MVDRTSVELLAANAQPSVLIGPDEQLLAVNDAASALLGQAATGRHFATLLRQPDVTGAIERVLHGASESKARLVSTEGAVDLVHEVTCRPIPSLGRQGVPAVLVGFRDLTPEAQAGQMRRDFVANVSHELRTPLTALMGFIETLRGSARNDAEARERFLSIMAVEAGRMNRLIDDLLSLGRVESEERMRPRERVELIGLLTSTLATLRPVAESTGVALSLIAPTEPVEIAGDPDQLRQVFTNLVENAVKYGASGGRAVVTITPPARHPALRTDAVQITVRDFGAGIDPVHLPRLTERFYRADNHRSRQLGGTGLGLAIVKHIVNRHRGRLKIDSVPGEGATFTVILPT